MRRRSLQASHAKGDVPIIGQREAHLDHRSCSVMTLSGVLQHQVMEPAAMELASFRHSVSQSPRRPRGGPCRRQTLARGWSGGRAAT